MAAGLGFKTFNTGDVLTAGDTNGYLMQGVWVFANAAARTSAVTSPQEGNVSFLKDTNSLEIYDGAAWVAYGSGDITGVTAGTGISGGGNSGTVTITNSMATEITAAGDIIVGTGSGTFDNLPIGTTGQVLTADTTVSPYQVKWATSSSGGYTSLASGSLSTGSGQLSLTSISGSYRDLVLIIRDWYPATNGAGLSWTANGVTSYDYFHIFDVTDNSTINSATEIAATSVLGYYNAVKNVDNNNVSILRIFDYANTSSSKVFQSSSNYMQQNNSIGQFAFGSGTINTSAAITSISWGLASGGGNFAAGTYELFGVK